MQDEGVSKVVSCLLPDLPRVTIKRLNLLIGMATPERVDGILMYQHLNRAPPLMRMVSSAARELSMIEFKTDNGEKLSVEYENCKVTVQDENGQEVGLFTFREIEVPDGYSSVSYLHLCQMDLGGYTGQGLGRLCLKVARDQSGMTIAASDPNDHEQKDDGSHLVGDGPGFVRKMQAEGLISGGEGPDDEE